MTTYTPKDFSSQIFGIAGAGISLGLLAHTMQNVTRMTDSLYEPQRPRKNKKTYHQRRPYNSYNPYRWKF
jgi:hypothetical protein